MTTFHPSLHGLRIRFHKCIQLQRNSFLAQLRNKAYKCIRAMQRTSQVYSPFTILPSFASPSQVALIAFPLSTRRDSVSSACVPLSRTVQLPFGKHAAGATFSPGQGADAPGSPTGKVARHLDPPHSFTKEYREYSAFEAFHPIWDDANTRRRCRGRSGRIDCGQKASGGGGFCSGTNSCGVEKQRSPCFLKVFPVV
ncbi:hypothetical protein HAX54_051818 [Datura stramonium]|uniref:Uncharacterized protein n=1 Tax=Datura stramonium TaxID=4076 RepID=A0ABS8RRP9_DATST|nr:hypothetical protein [Datura stramonium]